MSNEATAYVYQNVGGPSAPTVVGAVRGIAGRLVVALAYVYQNVT